jgi:hypothetical protein
MISAKGEQKPLILQRSISLPLQKNRNSEHSISGNGLMLCLTMIYRINT